MDPVATFDLPRADPWRRRRFGPLAGRLRLLRGTLRGPVDDDLFEIEPGARLGWHTDQTEETQYIVSGIGDLHRDDGIFPVGPGSAFVLPTNVRHDLVNTGTETLRVVGFFSAAMFTQIFDNVMQPFNGHVMGTPNREG